MAFDGIFMRAVAREAEEKLIGGKIDKISQPAADLVLLSFRSIGRNEKLLLSVNPSFPRVHITGLTFENPQVPPMFCTVLRKHLMSAQLCEVRMKGFERVLEFVFKAYDDFGDLREKRLIIEIMGRYSNIILVDDGGNIIESAKRVDVSVSGVRQVLPHLKYEYPPKQTKTDISGEFEFSPDTDSDMPVFRYLIERFEGFSPLVAKEMSYLATGDESAPLSALKNKSCGDKLRFYLKKLGGIVAAGSFTPYITKDSATGEPLDYSYTYITKFGVKTVSERRESFGGLLDEFYARREKSDNIKKKTLDILKLLSNNETRLIRKIEAQRQEISDARDCERMKKFGDLITANLYRIERGSIARLEDYSDGNGIIKIPLDEALTPVANAKKYYTEYKKMKTAAVMLEREIGIAEKELFYINSVLDSLSKVETESEIDEIRSELHQSGYLRRAEKKRLKIPPSKPLKLCTSDGFTVLVGKNNVQNDTLTLKTASKLDTWCHIKDYPGSHTVILSEGREVTDRAITEACELAAYYSKVHGGSNVAVDYTLVKNVKKPSGAKPGMVIYSGQSTKYVTVDENKLKDMKQRD